MRAWLRPLSLPFADPEAVRISLLYLLYRLRDPQTFEGTLLECTRMQLDLFRRVELGGSRILQFDGDGAPSLSFAEFLALVEAELSGRTSQSDPQWLTGVTNAGRTLGSPLGPDTIAITARAELEVTEALRLVAWAGLVTLFDNTYDTYDTGPVGISVATRGPAEHRQRAGLDGFIALSPNLFLQLGLYAEQVDTFEYVPGALRFNAGARAALSYTP